MPQSLEYFKENAKDIPYSLLSEVLINNKNYEKEVKEMNEKSNEVSKKYIEEMNGHIRFESVYGGGTTFYIDIPQITL